MRGTFFKGALAGGIGAALVIASSAAFAGTGIGGVFNLGQTNTVNATSTLTGAKAGKMLQITNTSTGTGATALGLNVASGKAPFTVNSGTKVANLNADKLDGKEAAALVGARAFARVNYPCSNDSPPIFCTIVRGKGVAYVAHIGTGHYCVGVNGVDAAAHDSFAFVYVPTSNNSAAEWTTQNSGCVSSEFEVFTYHVNPDDTRYPADIIFDIIVP